MRLPGWLSRPRRPLTWAGRQEIRSDSQSLGFAVDICRVLQEELASDADEVLTLLDVGARTASGSNLLAQVFHPVSYSSLKLEVTALDLEDTHRRSALTAYPDIGYIVSDVRDTDAQYDVVTCSHTLEHIADPGPILEHLRSIARRAVIIAAPYAEVLDPAIPNPSNHLFSFDEGFFDAYPPDRLEVFPSPHWSAGDCFVAVYRTGQNDPG